MRNITDDMIANNFNFFTIPLIVRLQCVQATG